MIAFVVVWALLFQAAPAPQALEWFRKGEALIGTPQENSVEQLEYFKKSVAADPSFAIARFNLGLLYLQKGALEEAFEQLEAYTLLEPDQASGFFLKAQAAVGLGRLAAAALDLRRGVQLAPDDPDGWEILGQTLFDMGELDEALSVVESCLELKTARPESRLLKAAILDRMGRSEDAAAALRSYLEVVPDDADAHYQLGILALRLGRKEEALESLLLTEAARPDDLRLEELLGNLLLELGRNEEAYERLLKADHGSPGTLTNLGIIAFKRKRFEEAEGYLRRSLALDPQSALSWGYLADALVAQDKGMEALAAYGQAIEHDPEDVKSLLTAGRLAADNDRTAAALDYLQRALKLAPEDGFIPFSLAVLLERLGDSEGKAQALYLKSLELGEERPYAHFRLAFLFSRQGDRESALKHLRQALEADAKRFHPLLTEELRKIHSDLDSIRYSTEFAGLISEFQPDPESQP